MTTVKNIYDFINSIAPYDTQDDWDNSGHLVGDFRKDVKKCVMALDATKDVCRFAKDIGADLVLTHHPIIFGGISDVKADSAVYILANAGISALCAHTNFDKADGGINDNLAKLLGLSNTRHIGDGLIVCGELDSEMSIDDFAEHISNTLDCAGIRYTDTEKTIKSVALGGGACEEYMCEALAKADCFVTGDMKYHAMLEAAENDMAVISAGHFETENQAFLMLKDRLEGIFSDVEFIVAPRDNPIKTV